MPQMLVSTRPDCTDWISAAHSITTGSIFSPSLSAIAVMISPSILMVLIALAVAAGLAAACAATVGLATTAAAVVGATAGARVGATAGAWVAAALDAWVVAGAAGVCAQALTSRAARASRPRVCRFIALLLLTAWASYPGSGLRWRLVRTVRVPAPSRRKVRATWPPRPAPRAERRRPRPPRDDAASPCRPAPPPRPGARRAPGTAPGG